MKVPRILKHFQLKILTLQLRFLIVCLTKYQEITDISSASECLYAYIDTSFGKFEIGVEANAVGPYISEP